MYVWTTYLFSDQSLLPQLVSECQPENGSFGFHHFNNNEKLLPVLYKTRRLRPENQVCGILFLFTCSFLFHVQLPRILLPVPLPSTFPFSFTKNHTACENTWIKSVHIFQKITSMMSSFIIIYYYYLLLLSTLMVPLQSHTCRLHVHNRDPSKEGPLSRNVVEL